MSWGGYKNSNKSTYLRSLKLIFDDKNYVLNIKIIEYSYLAIIARGKCAIALKVFLFCIQRFKASHLLLVYNCSCLPGSSKNPA